MAFKIYLSPPHMGGEEIKFVQEAFDTNWIAPAGPSLTRFEEEMAQYTGMASALATSSGTSAIHLALRWFGVEKDDVVFCSDLTFAGSCNPILYQLARPVFIDSEPDTWNMSPVALEKAFRWAEETGNMPKAVIIVDLYGESADWDALLPICRKYGVPVIEDSAEAAGSLYKGKHCGSFGDIAVFSFNGNKILTTSGGGMVLSSNMMAVEKMRFWSTQAREPFIHYEHKEFGYNYRMSNVCAAIGRGQLRFLDRKVALRRSIHHRYQALLKDIPAEIKSHVQPASSNCWLNLLYIHTEDVTPSDVVIKLHNAEIEARPAWKPMHMQPVFAGCTSFSHYEDSYVDEDIFAHTVCLPSGDSMTDDQLALVIDEVKKCFINVSR
ncbi:MAG: aminotransferase class I/II-fold pyridoxal phosphate-dependent enzyme [Ruminococcaceae bacterium]|nr:aminotransferase class I/II-fold pyridoxal phosphate-dependent enzyme [Oscillospiraceae bacterium]